jgi:tryptophan synthase beta chain
MGSIDMERQAPNVGRMKLLGAEVVPVTGGDKTLRAAIDEALRDWVADPNGTYYLLGSVVGPHPYPYLVREFQSVIGAEARRQFEDAAGGAPDAVIASVGGGSNAIGIFDGFIDLPNVRLVGVEAGGTGPELGRHAARFAGGSPGIFQGTHTVVLQGADGNVAGTHSISAGLDYAAIGPEHAWLREIGRAEYASATDAEALDAFSTLARIEGILPALESAHAVAWARRVARELGPGRRVLVNLSGRGDKDVQTVSRQLGIEED